MDFEAELKTKYSWLSDSDVEKIVNKAKFFYYGLSYPADKSVDEITHPIVGFRAENWVVMACDEIVERLGFNSALAYRENGVSWTFDNCHISQFLVNLLPPCVGVIK